MATGAKEVSSGGGIARKQAGVCLVLAASLLLSACAGADNGAKGDPVLFGGAGGGNGGAGATSGVSVSW
jgi:hypothetical protein